MIANGETISKICAVDGMPEKSAIYSWLAKYSEFAENYARAREAQMEAMVDEIIEISDDGSNDTYTDDDGNERTNGDVIQRSKLRIDTRKWLMSKLAARRYGEKQQVDHTGSLTLTLEQLVTGSMPDADKPDEK